VIDELNREKKKKKMQAFLDKLKSENDKKRFMSYYTMANKDINKRACIKVDTKITNLKSQSSSVFFTPPVFGKKPSYRPYVKKIKYEESLLLSLKNHLTSYPTPTNLTHA
jgi:hypothetical protein